MKGLEKRIQKISKELEKAKGNLGKSREEEASEKKK